MATASFEISLKALMDCLNVFGNAAPLQTANPWIGKRNSLRRDDDNNDDDDDEGRRRVGRERRGAHAGSGDANKVTAARFSYAGVGYPLLVL